MGPKYRMMPDKGTAINAVALAAVVVLFVLVIFQGVTLVKMKADTLTIRKGSSNTGDTRPTRYQTRTSSCI